MFFKSVESLHIFKSLSLSAVSSGKLQMIMLFFFLSRSANSSAVVVAVDSSC